MNPPATAINEVPRDGDWFSANQRRLMAELGRVREVLAGRTEDDREVMPPDRSSASVSAREFESSKFKPAGGMPLATPSAWPAGLPPSALDSLVGVFGLSSFERDLLLLCAGSDLDAKFPALVAQLHGDPRRAAPTFSLALAALPDAHWSAISPSAPLRRWRLIEVGSGEALTSSPLRIDEWALQFLAGVPHLDERLRPLLRAVPPPAGAPTPSQQQVTERILRLCQTEPARGGPPLIELCAEDVEGALGIAAQVAAKLGGRLFRLSALDSPASPAERETLARLWEREAALAGGLLLVDARDVEPGEASRAVLGLIESVASLIFVLAREPLRGFNRPSAKFDVPRLSAREQRGLWLEALGPHAAELNGQLEAVSGQFNLNSREIRAAADTLRSARGVSLNAPQAAQAAPLNPSTLWSLCRAQSRARLESLAQRLEPAATWKDLVLPEAQLGTLREIVAHVRQRFLVFEEWGFAARGARGVGISALFAGASGTGKTLAAEVLAHELNLDLFRIDLSTVVSKYIGETEKNLRRVFHAAEAGGAILLFDEADALFGKRSEVKDSHDRYANIEVGYLLQQMETYRGLAILTTNFKQALDPAFLRRLRFVVPFPFPDAAQRAEIWRRMFPSATPTEGLDPSQLARLNMTGGSIRNIALHAAFLAADAAEPVRMKHLRQAACSECAKLERPPSETELGGWL